MNTEIIEGPIDPINLLQKDSNTNNKMSLKDLLLKVELNLIIASLNKSNGNQRKAAEILGIRPTTLHEKIKRHNIKFKKANTCRYRRKSNRK